MGQSLPRFSIGGAGGVRAKGARNSAAVQNSFPKGEAIAKTVPLDLYLRPNA